ncbi:DUF3450 domain-containing protein [Vibrio comitans]|uniref:DUF3450 domain-containing protein n=1 Tax=Vibrio comitans NBRC 102076 TaxID=1219078 RepID=A0A4Y3IRW0_9VIBR|nr:DUF3450 domain-containing protein [Vibrio comitans]GEA61490.1 DUF3450 domain-containing protein [Vibrio comitans NBRC 102076]
MNHTRMRYLLVAGLSMTSSLAMANEQATLQKSQNIETQITQSAAKTQNRVANSSDKAMQLEADIAGLKQEVHNLSVYNSHLEGLIASQGKELEGFDTQLSQIDDTRQSIVPLMYEMLEGLEKLNAEDRPIRTETRATRLDSLNEMMTQADVSDAEKYRRILEAYQIEMDYGTKMGAYSGTIEVDGKPIIAEQLYIGRVSLVARSNDRQRYWAWDDNSNLWVPQNGSVGREIDKAFDIAAKQASPSLLELPISLTLVENNKLETTKLETADFETTESETVKGEEK